MKLFLNNHIVFPFVVGILVAFVCGRFSVNLQKNLKLRNYGISELAYPMIARADYAELVGTWVLTDQSREKFRILMKKKDSKEKPFQDLAREVFPTTLQMILSGTLLNITSYSNDTKFVGIRDTWPMNKGNSLPEYHLFMDAELFSWDVVSDVSPEDSMRIEGGTKPLAKSWLIICYQFAPDLWEKSCYAIAKKNDSLILRRKFQFVDSEDSAILEWRKVSDTLAQ